MPHEPLEHGGEAAGRETSFTPINPAADSFSRRPNTDNEKGSVL